MKIHAATLSFFIIASSSHQAFASNKSLRRVESQKPQEQHFRSLVVSPIAGCPGSNGESFTVTLEDNCNYENVRDVIDEEKDENTCTSTADQIIISLLDASDEESAKIAVRNLCAAAYASSTEKFAFSDITQKGLDFDNEYYSGGTYWNYEVETNEGHNILRYDASRVNRIYEREAQERIIDLPTYIESFDPDKDGCDINAAFCCWTKDRQANDNNGNCATPYDSRCINKDPADNANFCYTDHSRSKTATHIEGGFSIFGDVQSGTENIEGPIHCHGFAWAEDDESDISSAYRGNNLFYVSMYDHMHQRGYVKNAPGSSMCACAENMAVVTRADCTEISADETFEISFDATSNTLSGVLTEVRDLDFNSCQGANNNNNDLDSYFQRLVNEGRQSQANLDKLRETLVGDEAGKCNEAIVSFLEDKGIVGINS